MHRPRVEICCRQHHNEGANAQRGEAANGDATAAELQRGTGAEPVGIFVVLGRLPQQTRARQPQEQRHLAEVSADAWQGTAWQQRGLI